MSTSEAARIAGVRPDDVIRFDGNTPPEAPAYASADVIAAALAEVQRYPHGGYPPLLDAIAEYAGVAPEQVVLGAGADDLILLCARAYAGPRDVVRVAHEPTYPLFRIGAWIAGAEVGDDDRPVLTFACRPHNPTGLVHELPQSRPLVVDEAYFEYAAETAVGLNGVLVIRTFSKAFGLAAARVGYLLADTDTAAALRVRQDPLPVASLSAALALAAVRAGPPDVSQTIEERERLGAALRELGYDPYRSRANFLYVPTPRAEELYDRLLRRGLVVRPFDAALRITVHTRAANERLLDALEQADG